MPPDHPALIEALSACSGKLVLPYALAKLTLAQFVALGKELLQRSVGPTKRYPSTHACSMTIELIDYAISLAKREIDTWRNEHNESVLYVSTPTYRDVTVARTWAIGKQAKQAMCRPPVPQEVQDVIDKRKYYSNLARNPVMNKAQEARRISTSNIISPYMFFDAARIQRAERELKAGRVRPVVVCYSSREERKEVSCGKVWKLVAGEATLHVALSDGRRWIRGVVLKTEMSQEEIGAYRMRIEG